MAADTLRKFTAANRWLTLIGVFALVACGSAPPGQPAPVVVQSPALSASQTSQAYAIDSAASTLHILVYRGGPMARLGHNHVISSQRVNGSIWRGATLERSGFDIKVPVNDLIVDDGAARAAEGEDFAATVSEEAREGTKANMLRESILDGARFPDIRIRSVSVQGDANSPTVVAALSIKNQTRHVTLPVTLSPADSGMRFRGEFEIRQTDFGITPLSVALGALQVVDTIRIRFELVARAQ